MHMVGTVRVYLYVSDRKRTFQILIWSGTFIHVLKLVSDKHVGVCELGNKLFHRNIMFSDYKNKNIPYLLLIKKKIIDVCITVK